MCCLLSKSVIFLSLFWVVSIQSCDHVTFNNVSITVGGVRGIDFISGCLEPDGTIEKASYVQITNQSVPILYKDSIHDLPNLVDIILDYNRIVEIKPGAFYNLPKLRLLRIKDNKLEMIKGGVFNHLTISELNLMNNSISVIEGSAFNDMPDLSFVNLDHNKIAQWDADWFRNSPLITTLSFKNNRLKNIPSGAFKHIQGLHIIEGRNVTTNIYLDENQIESMDSHAFVGLEVLGWLFLTKNKLEHIDPNLFSTLSSVDWVKLGYNKLTCVPIEVLNKVPSISNYLDGNPLSDSCKLQLKTL